MTFGQSYLTHMKCLENVGMLRTDPVKVGNVEVVPIQLLKELLPDPASLGPRTVGKTNIGCIFTGKRTVRKRQYTYIMCVTIRNVTEKLSRRRYLIQQVFQP